MTAFLERMNDPDELEKIIEFMETRDEQLLTPWLIEKLERVGTADSLIQKHGSRKRVIEMMRIKYPDLSEASLIRDFYDAKKVFNTQSLREKEYDREMWYQWTLQMAAKAKETNDFKAFEKMGHLAYKFGQFYLEEDDDPQAKIEPHNIEITFDLDLLGVPEIKHLDMKKKKLRKKVTRKKSSWLDDADDADFEDAD